MVLEKVLSKVLRARVHHGQRHQFPISVANEDGLNAPLRADPCDVDLDGLAQADELPPDHEVVEAGQPCPEREGCQDVAHPDVSDGLVLQQARHELPDEPTPL
eukprot:2640673-Rhodomonas_salina.1